MTSTLVIIRHGESVWADRFTGWKDVDLSEAGKREALMAAMDLKRNGFTFDVAYCSWLKRAAHTLNIILEELDILWIPVTTTWRLNERMYGALQGLNKVETAVKYGEEQVRIWRRSYNIPPPPIDPRDPEWPGHEARYEPFKDEVPLAESLKDVEGRLQPLWDSSIAVDLRAGKKVLIVTHGSIARCIRKYLDHINDKDIMDVEIPTGFPLVYELDRQTLLPVRNYFLADDEVVKAAAAAVANQTKPKQ